MLNNRSSGPAATPPAFSPTVDIPTINPLASRPSGVQAGLSNIPMTAQTRTIQTGSSQPPPVPPRTQSTMRYPARRIGYGSYGGMYGGMGGYSPYSMGYGGMGMYGGYGGGYGQFPTDNGRIMQVAEDTWRSSFEGVESFVGAVGSIATMLDATYWALYNSFRAVMGVVEQVSSLKNHLLRVLSSIAVIRAIRSLVYRILRLLRLSQRNPENEVAWMESGSGGDSLAGACPDKQKSSLPFVLMFSLVMGGPYLIWKLLSSQIPAKAATDAWASNRDEYVEVVAQYSFSSQSNDELSFNAGETLRVAKNQPRSTVTSGWLNACLNGKMGLIPSNYVTKKATSAVITR